jgi:hypothetical protein
MPPAKLPDSSDYASDPKRRIRTESLPSAVSVSGKRDFAARDKPPKSSPNLRWAVSGAPVRPGHRATPALFVLSQEITHRAQIGSAAGRSPEAAETAGSMVSVIFSALRCVLLPVSLKRIPLVRTLCILFSVGAMQHLYIVYRFAGAEMRGNCCLFEHTFNFP